MRTPFRISRILAVARYEMRSHMAGRQGLRLVALAFSLLLPAALLRFPSGDGAAGRQAQPAPDAVAKVKVRGLIPAALADKLVLDESAGAEVISETPLRLRTEEMSDELRTVLETLPEPARVEVRRYRPPVRLPGRSLIIAILAVSLLTGPLAEALPGERAARTLEVLLSAGISRSELITGKWLTWTASASLTAFLSAAVACWSGVQAPGAWIVGLPLFVASAVAFGLWLVRLVDDVVGGAAAPMRVLPVVAGALAGVARAVEPISPVAAAMVPLGGPLLFAADIFTSPAALLASAAACVLFVVTMLALTARDLDRFDAVSGIARHGAIGLGVIATLLWWLAVAGPGVWALAGNAKAASPLSSSLTAGGLALLGCAWVASAREGVWPWPPVSLRGVVVGFGVGVFLALGGPFVVDLSALPQWTQPFAARLGAAVTPSLDAPVAASAALVGQAWLFRFIVARRVGWPVGALLWILAVTPLAPLGGALAALTLGLLALGLGVQASLIAQATWTVLAGSLMPEPVFASVAILQALAVATAVLVVLSKAGLPRRQ